MSFPENKTKTKTTQYYKPTSISQITFDIKRTLEEKYDYVLVQGEVSNYKKHTSGHSYFSLIEGTNLLQCVCWKGKTIPKLIDGMSIICAGKITAYTGRSQFQLVIDSITISGQGNLFKLFEELKAKLTQEGLFDQSKKKPLPTFPKTVGVITGANSDALKDILKRLEERIVFRTIIRPVLVQGPQAPSAITKAIEQFNQSTNNKPDLLILSRGGGSIEDLWAFNEEMTVRAVAESDIPVITAVGHEMDVTLVDYAADKRAPTPTASIEMAFPKKDDFLNTLENLMQQITRKVQDSIQTKQTEFEHLHKLKTTLLKGLYQNKTQLLDHLADKIKTLIHQQLALKANALPQKPSINNLIALNMKKIEYLQNNIQTQIHHKIEQQTQRIRQFHNLLDSLSHKKVLQRGFCLAFDKEGNHLNTAIQAQKTETITIEFHDGIIQAQTQKS